MSKPGAMRVPPRLGKHQGFIVTSASLTGSQNPTEMPMRGSGSAQAQIGEAGLLVSGRLPGQIFAPPIDSGKRHDQQTSVIGLTNLPVQVGAASARGVSTTVTVSRARAPRKARSQRISAPPPSARGKRCRRHSSGEGRARCTARPRRATPKRGRAPRVPLWRGPAQTKAVTRASERQRACHNRRMRRSARVSGAAIGVRSRSSHNGISCGLRI